MIGIEIENYKMFQFLSPERRLILQHKVSEQLQHLLRSAENGFKILRDVGRV